MRIRVITLFPELFDSPLRTGLVGRAIERADVVVERINPRDFATDRHRTVDDQPFGGGGGMVLKVEPWAAAIEADPPPGPVVLLTPQGAPLTQSHFVRWSGGEGLTLVAGRYEGFDERLRSIVTEEVSLGDFVLTGGEAAAFAIIDGVVRLWPGTLGNADSPHVDSFSSGLDGLLEYPQYTRPPSWRGLEVPDVLRSGDHAKIDGWRRAQCVARTALRRPDRLRSVALTPADHAALAATWALGAPPRLVVGPGAGLSLERLWELAALYAVDVELVVGDEASAFAGRIEALPPRPIRASGTARRRRGRAPSQPDTVSAASRLRAVATPTAIPPGVPVVALDVGPEEEVSCPRVALGELRRAQGPVLVVGGGLPPEAWTGAALPVRPAGVGADLAPEVRLGIQLDRLFGEA